MLSLGWLPLETNGPAHNLASELLLGEVGLFLPYPLPPIHAESNPGEQRWAQACEGTPLRVVLTVLEAGSQSTQNQPVTVYYSLSAFSPLIGDHAAR